MAGQRADLGAYSYRGVNNVNCLESLNIIEYVNAKYGTSVGDQGEGCCIVKIMWSTTGATAYS